MGWERGERAREPSLNSPLLVLSFYFFPPSLTFRHTPLRLSSNGDDRRIFGGLKSLISGSFGQENLARISSNRRGVLRSGGGDGVTSQ